jgi:hypothetical protein
LFAITGAFAYRFHTSGNEGDWFGFRWSIAVGSSDANTLSILQESFLAEASNDAIASADWARMWIGACGRASGTARVEDFVFAAFWDWWKHHERF